jgi:phosphoserine phosphatase
VCTNEAIDELAELCEVGSKVQELSVYYYINSFNFNSIFYLFIRTRQAMGGNMTFREALRIRLDIIKPSYEKVQELNRQQANKLTPRIKYDIKNLLKLLVISFYDILF